MTLQRMWINQPSILQPHYTLHAINVLAHCECGNIWRVYFLSGDVISQRINKSALSMGWLPK